MNKFEQTSSGWLFMVSERAFVSSAIQGIGISLAFAFIMLLVATRNIIIALESILCVAYTVVSVLAIMHMRGQQLGIIESISVVIIIGFSVDYVIHLAADYTHSKWSSRNDKIKQAYREMGISILSGMITTAGSGFFLFGCVYMIFQKFAVLISATICIAFLSSMVLFGAICHTFGPQHGLGEIPCPCDKKAG